MDLSVIVNGVISLFLIILVGVYAAKKRIITKEINKGLTNILLKITLPCLVVSSFIFDLSDELKEDNRIEYIFNLMNDSGDTDQYSTFRFFYAKLSGKTEQDMNTYWEKVQAYYQRFNEWFSERELYHKIGFILTAKIAKVRDIYSYSSTLKKSEFIAHIDGLIKHYYRNQNLFDLDYENTNTKSILLL